ncbi:uncharacterized protein LOC103480216 [Poecilia reticulata]|uniref:uncharacterized protein LOC103480216 n=1 Tax=Poecilia reticulata TaxID=8081 RepID=UPI0004A3EEFE|nr:PREDICTED: uncharacterized protein LOC103480216 [Poecilia reticulata]
MQQVVWIIVVLLNVVWISFFLTPDLDFSVFVERRSISSSDETFMMEFCLQPDSDRKWTSAGPSASGPDGDISTITERPVNGKKTQYKESNSGDKFSTSAAPDPDQIDLNGPTVSTDEQRLTPPPEFSSSSEADLLTKIPTTPRNQKVNINRPRQHKITLSPLRPGPGMNGKKTQTPNSIPDDKFPTSAAPDPDEISLAEPTVSAHEQRLTSPPGLNSSSNLVTKIPTTPRNQRMDISRPVQQELLSLAFPADCCFVLMKGPVNEKLIASVEVTDPCCPINAAILITKKTQHLCVDPKEPWVKRIIDFLQTRDLDGPTLSTPYESLTLSEVTSSPMLRQHFDVNLATKIPTTPRHQKTIITLSPLSTEPENGTGPVECCFQVCKNPVDIRETASFHMTDPLCPTSAAVLITKTAKHLCADPKEQWVKTIINFLETKAP